MQIRWAVAVGGRLDRVREPAGEGDHAAGDRADALGAAGGLDGDGGRAGVQELEVAGVGVAAGVAGGDVVDAAPDRVVVGVRAQAAAAAVDHGPCLGVDAVGDLVGGVAEFGPGQGGHGVADSVPDPGDGGVVPAEQVLGALDGVDAAEQRGLRVGRFCLEDHGPQLLVVGGSVGEVGRVDGGAPGHHGAEPGTAGCRRRGGCGQSASFSRCAIVVPASVRSADAAWASSRQPCP